MSLLVTASRSSRRTRSSCHRRPGGDRHRRPRRDHAAVLPQEHDREGRRASGPTRRSSSPAATSMSARAATSATRRWSGRCATRSSATATTRSRPRACTTSRSSGARSAPVRISRASAASIPTNGTRRILPSARSCRSRSCRAIRSCRDRARLRRAHRDDLRTNRASACPIRRDDRQCRADLKAQADPDNAGADRVRQALSEGGLRATSTAIRERSPRRMR